jgi:hypothetical protein
MMAKKPRGLAALTGNRYRITLEESWHFERPEIRTPDRIWYEQIPCKDGAFIGVYSLEPLVLHLFTARVKNAGLIWKAIQGIAGTWADFHFDGEAELFFPLEAVHTVAALARARKKRRLSEAQKAKLLQVGQAYRFKGKFDGAETPKIASF